MPTTAIIILSALLLALSDPALAFAPTSMIRRSDNGGASPLEERPAPAAVTTAPPRRIPPPALLLRPPPAGRRRSRILGASAGGDDAAATATTATDSAKAAADTDVPALVATALPPAPAGESSEATPDAVGPPAESGTPPPPPSSSSSTTTFTMTREMRRVLIEELRYTRAEVDSMRVELAGPVVEKRISRPPDGMPESWRRQEEEPNVDGGMLGRLERESRYPLKAPLLAISLILGGKGLGDAIITLIKINTGFPGASLGEEFMGVNVLGIDVLCVLAGIALGSWTWRTMKD